MLRRYYAKLGLPNDDAKKGGAGDRDNVGVSNKHWRVNL